MYLFDKAATADCTSWFGDSKGDHLALAFLWSVGWSAPQPLGDLARRGAYVAEPEGGSPSLSGARCLTCLHARW
mgnify:CR=1 FL=1